MIIALAGSFRSDNVSLAARLVDLLERAKFNGFEVPVDIRERTIPDDLAVATVASDCASAPQAARSRIGNPRLLPRHEELAHWLGALLGLTFAVSWNRLAAR
jgi:hypothetical protein